MYTTLDALKQKKKVQEDMKPLPPHVHSEHAPDIFIIYIFGIVEQENIFASDSKFV